MRIISGYVVVAKSRRCRILYGPSAHHKDGCANILMNDLEVFSTEADAYTAKRALCKGDDVQATGIAHLVLYMAQSEPEITALSRQRNVIVVAWPENKSNCLDQVVLALWVVIRIVQRSA